MRHDLNACTITIDIDVHHLDEGHILFIAAEKFDRVGSGGIQVFSSGAEKEVGILFLQEFGLHLVPELNIKSLQGEKANL